MLATHVVHLYLTFGILTGIGIGIAYVPTITVVGFYFDRKRSIAIGLAVCGLGVGTCIFPPIIRYLVDTYGWRYALLITGALMGNVCVCGALMRPIGIVEKIYVDVQPVDQYKPEEILQYNPQELQQTDNNNEDQQQLKADIEYSPESASDTLFNLHILKNVDYLFLLVQNLIYSFGNFIVYVHLSAYAGYIGFTDYQGAMLFTVMGFTNTVGRLAFGFVAHSPKLSPTFLYMISHSLSGLITLTCPALTSYYALMTYAGLFGFITAGWGSLLPVVIVDILTTSMLTSAYGYVLLAEAIGTVIGPPIAGWLFDTTALYSTSFYLGGAAMFVSGLLMLSPVKHHPPACCSHQSSQRNILQTSIDNKKECSPQ